jgi:formate-dependent nitrite reductase membrane component NrfD
MRPERAPSVFRATKAPPWHGWVSADLFLSSLGAGTFIVAALSLLMRPMHLGTVARLGFVGVFPIMLADLLCLIIDLGDPARFLNMLRVFKPGSPMSVGVWTIGLLTTISLAACAAVFVDLPRSVLTVLAAVGLAPAIVVSLYKGVLLSATAQPGWRRMRWLGAAFATSSIASGAALMLLLAWRLGDMEAASVMRIMMGWLLVLNAIAVRMVMGQPARSGHLAEPAPTPEAFQRRATIYTLFMVGGIGAPIVLAAVAAERPALGIAAAALALAGMIVSRHYLVMIPHREELP